jgi:asparagine N-glycosylation enzyme membrane subunit Stt3
VVFNLIDYVMTIRVLGAGGLELNPVMQRLFETGWETAALVKLLTAGTVSIVLLALRRYRRTLEVSLLILLGYSALTIYHVYLAIRFH